MLRVVEMVGETTRYVEWWEVRGQGAGGGAEGGASIMLGCGRQGCFSR